MTFLTDLYNAEFDGVEFVEIYQNAYAAEPDSGVEFSETKIPGGSKTIIQTAGPGTRKLDMPIAVIGAGLTSLRSKADNSTRDTLEYHAGSVSARLLQVVNVRKQAMDDAYTATLRFVMG